MSGKSPEEEEAESKKSLNLRINIFFFSTFIIFCVVIVRLAYIQFVWPQTLTESEANQNTKNIPLPPDRGNILDATGIKLAYSKPAESLYITLQKDYSKKTDIGKKNRPEAEKMAEQMASVFKRLRNPNTLPMTKDEIIDAMDLESKKDNGYLPRRIEIDLNQKEIQYFMEHKSEFPGIEIIEETIRQYDPDTVAVQTVGYIKSFKRTESLKAYNIARQESNDGTKPDETYTRDELVGFDGIELSFQDELRGKNGYKVTAISPGNIPEEVLDIVPPVKGNDVWLTINKEVQLKSEQAIKDQLDWLHTHSVSGKTHPEAVTGYAVAMEVDTGNVVAMASIPDYDTNIWKTGWASTDDFKKLNDNYQNGAITPLISGKSKHKFDSAVLLGSTIKPLSVLIGLNEKLFTTTTTYNDTGVTYFGKEQKPVRNSGGHPYGSFKTPADAIEKSSNVFMVDMVGNSLYKKYGNEGVNKWDRYMKEFGLGVSTGIDLPREYLGTIDYRPAEGKKNTIGSPQAALVYASFGQGGKYTPLQLAQYTATLANDGERIKPKIVSKITDASGKVVQQSKREVLNTIKLDPSYWKLVRKGMNTKIETAFAGFPYDFARKTGTSQQDAGRDGLIDNGVFIAYAPRNHPKLAVAVVIPEGGFGANSAAPVARKIFDAYDWEYGLDGVPKKQLQNQNAVDEAGKGNDQARSKK
ncbi:penicillin-binding transpeptidase domain-containing protein [Paenibacillus sp.]|jgi:penicillin-binding protein 2|uniref:peptidoglycan D,D-transpeptidase FtsI family protein n=1 Tax=Paenibacillus sp. TaxID=58172 RepID=UPI00281CF74D|nr:penicillin-binding transpeptidase domain-containing protein [Paenibacillus sp.]MDR0268254.1 penicillin-binding protein 2 [Paenibacillus sp.]